MRKVVLSLFLLSAILFNSCDEQTSQNTNTGPVALKFNFVPGTQYQYLLDSKLSIEPELNGSSITINQDMKLIASYVVSGAVKNGKQVSITYDRITMKSGNIAVTKEFDSDDTGNIDPMFQSVYDMVHKPFNMIIADNGDVVSVDQAVDSNLNVAVTDSSIRKMMTQSLNIYPNHSVKAGDTWDKTFSTSIGFINMNLENHYKLVSVTDNIAHIELSSKITPEISADSMAVNMDITGVQTGTFDVETGTGLITEAKISQQMKGMLNIGGTEAPINAKADIHISGSRVK